MALLSGALTFEKLTAADVVISLDHLVTIEDGSLIGDVQELAAQTGFSRFPITKDGTLTGYVHVKDLLRYSPDLPIPSRYVHELGEVEADQLLADVMRDMQATHSHMALMVQDGAHTGLVALEDVLEELVGEVRDATTPDEPVSL